MTSSSKPEQRDLFRGTLEMMILLRSLEREFMHGFGLVKAKWEISASNCRVPTYRIAPSGKKTSRTQNLEF